MARRFIFSSESVGEGHPDKVCDTISDAVLDACLAQDPTSRVACETYAKSNVVIVGGEITTKAKLDYVQLVRDAVREIGYTNDDDVFHADKIFVTNIITAQSPDIAQGVDEEAAEGKATAEQGAGDQGLMFGYACNETPELMPAPIMFAHRLGRALTRIRKSGKVNWLRPDAKSQVSRHLRGQQARRHFQRRHLHPARRGRGQRHDPRFPDGKRDPRGAARRTCSTTRPNFSSTRRAVSSSAGRRATPG